MKDTFTIAVDFVLKWEGGDTITRDSDDPGGTTKWGISKRSFPLLNIENLTREDAVAIYRDAYWHKAGCDNLPTPMDMIVFDTAVNMGVGAAKAILGRTTDPEDYLWRRLERYVGLNRPKFLAGWVNRVIDLRKATKGV